ncbi:beta strand repeat-containing protein, partial [Flavobacterium sp. GB2R13]|uniref:beta strand repeat-containing protein n=1 Tax=Flavobacterium algoris TaxID=3398733 RepID=UPI003A8B3904
MKHTLKIFFILFYLFLLGPDGYAQIINVIDNKGTIKKIENSKWLFSADGNSIYNTATDKSVSIGTTSADGSAVLDVSSLNKGFLPPRLTNIQRNAIITPAVGLCIFNTDSNAFEVNIGTVNTPSWQSIADSAVTTEKIKDGTITSADLSATASIANTLNTAITNNNGITTTVYPTFVTGTTGNLPQNVADGKLSFVPSTGVLSATKFAGDGSGLTAITATTNANLTGPITSSGNATSVASQSGTGSTFVMNTAPTLVTPVLGVATATTVNKLTLTAPGTGATLTLADGSSLVTSGSFSQTLTATAATNVTLPTTGTLATLAGIETLTDKTFVAPALGTPASGVGTNLTGTASGLTAGSVTTNANLTGEVTSLGNVATVPNATVIGKLLTGYTSGAGVIASTDNILQAIQKLDGNKATNANLTGPITSSGNATSVASQSGTGSTFVMDTAPTLVTPVLGAATATTVNKLILTAPATTATLTLAEGSTL